MALHRDIFWVGRQWAVTGYGVQACDQKQKGHFDIEASRLWDDDADRNPARSRNGSIVEDFDKALAIARQAFPWSAPGNATGVHRESNWSAPARPRTGLHPIPPLPKSVGAGNLFQSNRPLKTCGRAVRPRGTAVAELEAIEPPTSAPRVIPTCGFRAQRQIYPSLARPDEAVTAYFDGLPRRR